MGSWSVNIRNVGGRGRCCQDIAIKSHLLPYVNTFPAFSEAEVHLTDSSLKTVKPHFQYGFPFSCIEFIVIIKIIIVITIFSLLFQ